MRYRPNRYHTYLLPLFAGPSTNIFLAWGIGNNTLGYRTAGPSTSPSPLTIVTCRPSETPCWLK